MPRVSIVLPVHNAQRDLARAVASVRTQTLADWELIVIDDGSTDGSGAVARTAAGDDARVRVLAQPHGGIVAALNAGLAAAGGAFLARMDADDVMHPERLAAQAGLLEARPDLGVVSCLVAFGGDPVEARGYALHVEWINHLVDPEAIALHRFVESPLAHPSAMFRRELVARLGGYAGGDEPEDYELWLRWLDAGVRFAKVPRVLLTWHDAPARLSRTDGRYATDAFYRCKCRYLARWLMREVGASRPVHLWGAGRITRRRFRPLAAAGVRLAGYIDVDPRKTGRTVGGLPVRSPEHLPPPEAGFVLVGVGTRGARELIAHTLEERGFAAGRDYLLVA